MPAAQKTKRLNPQGIEADTHASAKSWHRYSNLVGIFGLALFLGLAAFGIFGGQPHPTRVIETPAARLTLQFPEILRNGEFFEMRATIEAKQPFDDLQMGISSEYWRDLTINTMIPAPSEEKSENGRYLFSYGPLSPGDRLTIKIDGQINPPMSAGTRGRLTLMDGDTVVLATPVKLRVFP
jgi:hypothetical protein